MYSWNTYAVFSITWLHNELKKKIKTLNANISKYHPYIIGNKVWDLSQKKLPPEQSFSSLWYSAKIEVCSKYIILGENLEVCWVYITKMQTRSLQKNHLFQTLFIYQSGFILNVFYLVRMLFFYFHVYWLFTDFVNFRMCD